MLQAIITKNIYRSDVGSLKGKTVRRKDPYVEWRMVPIPEYILHRHREVKLCFYLMFVNRITLLMSIISSIKFCTTEDLRNRKTEILLTGLKRIKITYRNRGFLVNIAADDNEFVV